MKIGRSGGWTTSTFSASSKLASEGPLVFVIGWSKMRRFLAGCTLALSFVLTLFSWKTTWAANSQNVTVAVLLYGLSRSMEFTVASIRKNILSELSRGGIAYSLFIDGILVNDRITNARSNEYNASYDISEWSALAPKVMSVTVHEEFLKDYAFLVHKALSKGDNFNNGGISVRNGVESLLSLRNATKLMIMSREYFDGIIVLRPDLEYLDPIDVDLLHQSIRLGMIVTPSWQRHLGENDRFAYGAWDAMVTYGSRIDDLPRYMSTSSIVPFNQERFLKWRIEQYCARRASVELPCHCFTSQRAARVRHGGAVVLEKFTPQAPPRSACEH